jgi:hypothetical protein
MQTEPTRPATYADVRTLINQALHEKRLRAQDCRQVLSLQAAAMPNDMIIEYLHAMINYAARARAATP